MKKVPKSLKEKLTQNPEPQPEVLPKAKKERKVKGKSADKVPEVRDETTTYRKQKGPVKNKLQTKVNGKIEQPVGGRDFVDSKSMVREDPAPYEVANGKSNGKLRFIDLFAGIGGIRIGFERAGGKCVFSSEWDEEAGQTYEAYFGDKPAGDITKIQNSEIPDHDILVGGFPCQAFSIIGGMKGFGDTRGTLFFEIERILRAKNPKAFLLENARNLVSNIHCN